MSDQMGTPATSDAAPAPPPERSPAWKRVLTIAAVGEVLGLVLVMGVLAGLIIPPLAVFCVLVIVGAILLRRPGKVGVIWLAVVSLLLVVLNIPAITESLAVPASIADFMITLLTFVSALTALVASIALLARARDGGARVVGSIAIAVLVIGIGVSVVAKATYDEADLAAADIALEAVDIEFSDESLEADAGEITVAVSNEDVVLHTFTIDELDVNVNLPANATAATTFEAEPGTYRFYCAIEGHETSMNGTLEVR